MEFQTLFNLPYSDQWSLPLVEIISPVPRPVMQIIQGLAHNQRLLPVMPNAP
jgi:hypothetical protein